MEQDKKELLKKVDRLMEMYAQGLLGGEVMPEDVNPGLAISSAENYAYFTLPMALNYQRNSYALWKSARRSYMDAAVQDAFNPLSVANMDLELLKDKLTKYGVALQPNKQPVIWKTICVSIVDFFDGDIRNLFLHCDYSVRETMRFLAANKKGFPYLSGNKIANYWLFVMQKYTDLSFVDRDQITVAPDTHVIQASVKFGLISPEEANRADTQKLVADRWNALLAHTGLQPIDVHTPLWLWSRRKFTPEI